MIDPRRRPRFVAALVLGCLTLSPLGGAETPRERRMSLLPATVLWAWERPEDLRELAAGKAVAFLAQTITLGAGAPSLYTRRQPLRVSESIPLIAVTRIESPRPKPIALAEDDMRAIVDAIVVSARLPRVVAVQIDFDATDSQRPLYLALLRRIRAALDEETPLSMTALASWCVGDRWLNEAPVDEVVPMLFRMGPATDPLKRIASAPEAIDPRCRRAVGTSLDEPLQIVRKGRRVYAFSPAPWSRAAVNAIEVVER